MPTIEKTSKPNDANGNMVLRGDQTISWNADNMPAAIAGFDDLTTFVYDGDGGRVVKNENGETTVYVNLYFELNLTTGNATAYYYLGSRLVALKAGANLRFVHQDHLTGTSLTTDSSGDLVARVKYYPYGETRSSSGALDTDRMFTGQRLDGTGLYFYNARYYDPLLGRFISPDSIVPMLSNAQDWNRYAYALNNPLAWIDPSGHGPLDWIVDRAKDIGDTFSDAGHLVWDAGAAVIHHDDEHWDNFCESGCRLLTPRVVEERLETEGGTYHLGLTGNVHAVGAIATGTWEVGFQLKGGFEGKVDAYGWAGTHGGGDVVFYSNAGGTAGFMVKATNAESIHMVDPDTEAILGACYGQAPALCIEAHTGRGYDAYTTVIGASPGVLGGEFYVIRPAGFNGPVQYPTITSSTTTAAGVTWFQSSTGWLMYDPADPIGSDVTAEEAAQIEGALSR